MVMAALRSDAAIGRTLPLAGPRAWSTAEVIALCEKLADCDAEVRNVPVWLLKGTRSALRSFQWAADAADRLAFAEVLSSNESFNADMTETYKVLGVDPASVTGLETYLQVRLRVEGWCVCWVGGLGRGGAGGSVLQNRHMRLAGSKDRHMRLACGKDRQVRLGGSSVGSGRDRDPCATAPMH